MLWHVHLNPTNSSWLNQADRFFDVDAFKPSGLPVFELADDGLTVFVSLLAAPAALRHAFPRHAAHIEQVTPFLHRPIRRERSGRLVVFFRLLIAFPGILIDLVDQRRLACSL